MMKPPGMNSDLVSIYELTIFVDEKFSTVRNWVLCHPEKLPRPIWLEDFPFWPWQQISAWVCQGEPDHFDADPCDFLPAPLAAYANERPEEPLKQLEKV